MNMKMKKLIVASAIGMAAVGVQATGVNATGGELSAFPGHKIHTFRESGTFTVDRPCTVDIMLVGGGGGGHYFR